MVFLERNDRSGRRTAFVFFFLSNRNYTEQHVRNFEAMMAKLLGDYEELELTVAQERAKVFTYNLQRCAGVSKYLKLDKTIKPFHLG